MNGGGLVEWTAIFRRYWLSAAVASVGITITGAKFKGEFDPATGRRAEPHQRGRSERSGWLEPGEEGEIVGNDGGPDVSPEVVKTAP
jgi:hypothetical protein